MPLIYSSMYHSTFVIQSCSMCPCKKVLPLSTIKTLFASPLSLTLSVYQCLPRSKLSPCELALIVGMSAELQSGLPSD